MRPECELEEVGQRVAFASASVTILGETMEFGVVGREGELASVRAFVERSDEGLAALVLEGEAGIGKSTLWRAGVEHACARGLQVLSARPAETETGLTHAGLGDLLEDVLNTVRTGLSAPRRRALEGALLLDETDVGVDDRALAAAVRDVLQVLATQMPVLVAVDDVQWLDSASSSALAFALRRMGQSRVLVLLARRDSSDVGLSEFDMRLGTHAWTGCRSVRSARSAPSTSVNASAERSHARHC